MRHEFSKAVKRQALARSGKLCEATGEVYGLEPGQRCNAPLSRGVEFDHWPVPATDKGSDTLENCVACCPTCHRFKTSTYDVPMQAKGKRIRDKHSGVATRSRGFRKSEPQRRATGPVIRWMDRENGSND